MRHRPLSLCCVFFLLWGSVAWGENYRARLTEAARVMAETTMTFQRKVGMGGAAKGKTLLYQVSQYQTPDGRVLRVEEEMRQGRVPAPQELRRGDILFRIYYTDAGETTVFCSARKMRGLRRSIPIPRIKILPRSEITGKTAEYQGRPCWSICQKSRDTGSFEEHMVDQETHVILRSRILDEQGRPLSETTYENFHFSPSLDPSLFTLPPLDELRFVKEDAQLSEAYQEIHNAFLQDWLGESSPKEKTKTRKRRPFRPSRLLLPLLFASGLTCLAGALWMDRRRRRKNIASSPPGESKG
ncbi:MAG: hypothetical protein ACI4SG_01310 [Oligosphaeraceae bacterium]